MRSYKGSRAEFEMPVDFRLLLLLLLVCMCDPHRNMAEHVPISSKTEQEGMVEIARAFVRSLGNF